MRLFKISWTGPGTIGSKSSSRKLWGEDEYEARLIAHHAVPESNLTEAELRALEGPYRYLRDALGEVMPLKIEANLGKRHRPSARFGRYHHQTGLDCL